MSGSVETTDVVVIGSGPGGSIPAYRLAAAGAKVVVLERGPWVATDQFTHDLRIDSYTKIIDYITADGVSVVAGNCVGGSSVVYFAGALRAPSFVFDRRDEAGHRIWPKSLHRASMDRWYDLVEHTLPIAQQTWDDVPFAGGVWAAACHNAGHTCNPVPVAVDLAKCTNCNWMLNGCRFGAKRSMLLNYLPAAKAHGTDIRPLHEVQSIGPATTSGYRYQVSYSTIDATDYRVSTGAGAIEAKLVIVAAGAMATPAILQRSASLLGGMPPAVGRYFSPNGDRVSMALLDEKKVRQVLGLERKPGIAYEAFPIGKPIGSMTYDFLDAKRPAGSRYGLQQIYFPTITNILPESHTHGEWFGPDKKQLTDKWRSWLTVLAMVEDGNEGVFGTPPPTGAFVRIDSAAALSTLSYKPTPQTRDAWRSSDAAIKRIIETDGVGKHLGWTATPNALTAHPLSSCRIGDDPSTSALTPHHELRGHPGVFVTDGSSVPTSLCVNPSVTIAALAERASRHIVRAAKTAGIKVHTGQTPPPGNGDLGREPGR
jgi:choline dehydrogenase-like flavoprotein